MRTLLLPALTSIGLICADKAHSAGYHTRAELLLPYDQVEAGSSFHAGIELRMDSGWHIYWKNPGESGAPTRVQWSLPPRFQTGELEWPVPRKWTVTELTTYGYTNSVMLLVPILIGPDVPNGSHTISAELKWLECADLCVPGRQFVSAVVTVGPDSRKSEHFDKISKARHWLPKSGQNVMATAHWDTNRVETDERDLLIRIKSMRIVDQGSSDFFPFSAADYEISGPTEREDIEGDSVLRKRVIRFSGEWPETIHGLLLISNKDGKRMAAEVILPIAR